MTRRPLTFARPAVTGGFWRGLWNGLLLSALLWAAAWPWFIWPALVWLGAVIAAAGRTVGGW